ncbi:MAG: Asp/Glu racemase [Rhodospirillales bacterium]|jgi:maleate isomerase|nr:Asp/Glu racemase [Rhodospirillales bacterium]
MDTQILTKPQEPWIGKRGRIGVIIPSTNTGVEYDCLRLVPQGVTWHFSRFWVEYTNLSSDDAFMDFVHAIRDTIPGSLRDIMTAEVDYIMMGMSAETFWGGVDGNDEFVERLREQIGPDMGVTTGADSVRAAMKKFGSKDIAVVTPYQPIGDQQVMKFFTESGFNVKRLIGMKCDTATSIAHTPRGDVMDLVLNQLDGDDVDTIVQVGTNLSTLDLFPAIERMIGKPVLPINVTNMWHALRAIGVNDKFHGYGRLFEEF